MSFDDKDIEHIIIREILSTKNKKIDERIKTFLDFMDCLVKETKYDRLYIFNSINNVMNLDIIHDDEATILGEYLSLLTGYCSPNSIVRFPGDTGNSDALTEIVREGRWKKGT